MDTATLPPPPPLPPRQKASRGPLPFVLLGCGGFLLLVLCGVAVFGSIMYFGGKSVDPAVEKFFSQLNAASYAEIYADAAPRLKEVQTEEAFTMFLTGVADSLGPYQSKSMRGINMNTFNGVSTAVATYQGHFAKGDASVVLTFEGAGETWKLLGVNFNSPLLQAALKCPHCGAELREFARFCPNCGKEIRSVAAESAPPQ